MNQVHRTKSTTHDQVIWVTGQHFLFHDACNQMQRKGDYDAVVRQPEQ